jgi:2-oxoglutarate ferredoxin oxidoreductase subunit alpha
MAEDAFNLAELFQTPVFINTDLDLGMNNWMAEPFRYSEKPLQRGKVLTAEDLRRVETWGRYKDVDGDGVPYRTLPGTEHPSAAYFTRGSGHNEFANYTEKPEDYVRNVDRLRRKFESIRSAVPEPEVEETAGAKIGLICCGTSKYAVQESRFQLQEEYGIDASYLRPRAYPFSAEVVRFIRAHERVYVIDQNRDAQLLALLRLELDPEDISRLRSVRYYGGLPLDARTVTEEIVKQEAV